MGHYVLNGAIYALQYDLLNDFAPIAMIVTGPLLMVSRKDLPANDLKELIAWLKANPDKATAGTAGAGSPPHIAGVLFQKMTGTQFQFVPYRGAAPAMQDLLAGQIDLMFDQAANVAAAAARRHDQGLCGHAQGTPCRRARHPDRRRSRACPASNLGVARAVGAQGHAGGIIAKLNAAVGEALADPATQRAACRPRVRIFRRADQQTPEALGAFQKAEIEKWWPIVKAAGIKAE